MNWISYFIYVIMLTCLTGSAWTGIWFIANRFLKGNGNAKLIYRLLKITMAGYLIPALFLVEFVYYQTADAYVGFLFSVTPKIELFFDLIFRIWLLGACTCGSYLLLKRVPLHRSCKVKIPISEKEQQILKQVCATLKIKAKIRVYHGYRVSSPFIYGSWRPCIYLPIDKIPEDELEMIFWHELTHYKQRDVFWKPVFVFICCIYWFNPMVWLVLKQFGRWSEASCDVKCCEKKYKPRDYFLMIRKILTVESQRFDIFALNLYEGENELKWRVKNMRRNKKMKAWLSVAITVCVVVVSTVSTYAAELGVKKFYDSKYIDTVVMIEEEPEDTEYEEYIMDLNELEGIEFIEIEASDTDIISPYATNTPIDWGIPANSGVKSLIFSKNAGDTIFISVSIDPTDKYVKVGYVDSENMFHYVNGCGDISHTFTLTTSGSFRVCIMNENSTRVTAYGYYR